MARSLLVLTGFAVCAALQAPPAVAAPPALAVLEVKGGLFGKRAEILDQPGASASPFANSPRQVWTLREGDTLRQPAPPPERLIRFYETVNNNTLSVCTVIVKYARSAAGWRPAYQLLIHPLVTFEGGQLKPLGSDEGARGQVQLFQPSTPNREGFYHTLSFGSTAGKIAIDAWEVQ